MSSRLPLIFSYSTAEFLSKKAKKKKKRKNESKRKNVPQLNGLWYNDYLRSADRGSILSAAKRCMTERHFKGSASDS